MIRVNYIYFGFFFLLLCIIHGFHALIVETTSISDRLLFLIPALTQSFIETLIIASIVEIVRERYSRKILALVISFTVFVFLIHTLDLLLIRIMGVTVWNLINFLLDESLHNFFEMIYAANLPIASLLLIICVAIGLPTIGYILFLYSQKLSEKNPYHLSYRGLLVACLGFCGCMVVYNLLSLPLENRLSQKLLERTLPWKTCFTGREHFIVNLPNSIKKPQNEEDFLTKIDEKKYSSDNKPNIFLFIIESFRKDIVADKEVCPNLYSFQENNLFFNDSFSNANATQVSWFSIFYSRFPFYWKHIGMDNWTSGSPSLQVLKKLGYKIKVYSSARLSYYQMDEIIFGKDKKMIDELHYFPYGYTTVAYESDTQVMEKLCEDAKNEDNQEGSVHIIFLDSTHFDYSWPRAESPFTPYAEHINYFTLTCLKKNIEEVKNSYKNAVHYLDSLFGKFHNTLQEQKQYKDSIIIVTGDHGEEFFEPHNIFHASDLSTAQTSVPMIFKIGDNALPISKERIISHIDIFPSILDHILGEDLGWDGSSIFKEAKYPFAIAGKYNASRTPQEFFIHNGKYKLMASFMDSSKIFSSDQLEIISIRDTEDTVIDNQAEIQKTFGPALDAIFSHAN